ncbi:Hsp20/alpha crystallin family protein [Halorubrum vacuolatum]|uniref:Heat shock protein Hsp20 n=1 Tax=Halorubrum vacuolatum TaxID=63740 RepID=A0A238X537_HALVU|nr:Hsp20/alpha crystallin family protein [Halorubrum vacuolatum]SNR53673.1 heat shock protein Hsp20 [Halorubrum vacuolatum]
MPRRDPFREIEELFERMGREFEELSGSLEVPTTASLRVDVAEDDENVIVTADMPGFEREEIDVELNEDAVTIAATHEDETVHDGSAGTDDTDSGEADDAEPPTTADAVHYHRRERRRQAVSRRIALPAPVKREGAAATYNNGVLTVTLPKRASDGDGGKSIEVS